MTVDVAGAAAALQAADDILILTHRRPDGDTTGCAGALCRALRQIGKTAYILAEPRDHAALCAADRAVLPAGGLCAALCRFDRYCGGKAVPGYRRSRIKGKVDLVIDHHGSNIGFGHGKT